MLVHERVAAAGGIKEAGAEHPFGNDQDEGDAKDRRRQNLHPGSGIERPDKKRQPLPAHPFGPQTVNGGDEVKPGKNRGEADHKDT